MSNRRRLLVGILFVLTLVVGAGAVYIGVQLSQQPDVTPSITSASPGSTCCDNECNLGNPNICWCAHISGPGANQCTPDINADEWICGTGNYDGQICYTCPDHPEVPPERVGQQYCNSVGAQDCSSGKAACGGTTQPTTQQTTQPTTQQTTQQTTIPPGNCNDACGRSSSRASCNSPLNCVESSDPNQICAVGSQSCICRLGSNPTDPNCADITPTPTTIFGSACAEPCSTALGGNACPNDHTCVDNDGDGTGLCQLNSCINNPGSCYSDGCTPVPGCGEPCDPAEGSNACPNDHQCVDVGGQDLCQLNQCITTPSECESNGCDPLGAVTVDKTGTPSCSSTGLQSIVTYQIVVTNPDAGARTFTITDDLDPGVSDSDVSNISGGGSLSSGTITWTDVTISGGSSVTLTYQVVFPESAFNQTFTNTVVVTEAGIERGRDTEDLVPFCTPGTALISDEADRIIFAVALISTGLLMYRLGLHYKIGSFLWNTSVQEVVTKREILKGDPDDMRSFEKETLDDVLDDLD